MAGECRIRSGFARARCQSHARSAVRFVGSGQPGAELASEPETKIYTEDDGRMTVNKIGAYFRLDGIAIHFKIIPDGGPEQEFRVAA